MAPRDPRRPHEREPDDADPGTWGRPPAGGWGPADPYTGDPRREHGGETYGYGRDTPGPYGNEPEYGWSPPAYEPAAGRRHDPSWLSDPPPGRPVGRASGYPGTPRRAARRRQRPPWTTLAVAAAAVVAILVLGFVAPGWFVTRVLDPAAVQNGVTRILTDDYGVDGLADVRCPEGVEVAAGASFTCDATIDGDPVTVPVRVTDGDGAYEVGRPT
jgi:hypothetical protein